MYKVIRSFTDNQDSSHAYREGDIFPRDGLMVSQDRVESLASSNNRRGVPLIVCVEDRQECVSEVKEEPQEQEPSLNTPKKTKAKEKPKKNARMV